MGKSDTFLQQFGLNFLHIHSVVVNLHGMAVEAELVFLLVDSNEFILDCTHS